MSTPKSDALINALYQETRHVGQHNCPERWVKLCREMERENARLREALTEMVSVADSQGWQNAEIHNARDILANDQDQATASK
jgi:hypothetical protein